MTTSNAQNDLGPRPMPSARTADERTLLETTLEWYREGVLHKVSGMSQADATSSPLPSPTTAAGVVKHLALVEDHWFTVGIAQQPVRRPAPGRVPRSPRSRSTTPPPTGAATTTRCAGCCCTWSRRRRGTSATSTSCASSPTGRPASEPA